MVNFRTRDIFNGRYFQKAARFTIPLNSELDGRMVEMEVCEAVVSRCPDDIEALTRLGHLYTELGEYEKGLEADLRLTDLCPDSALAWYNRACSHALLVQTEEGLAALERAVDLGYEDIEHMQTDPDLTSIRGEEKYKRILGRILEKRASIREEK